MILYLTKPWQCFAAKRFDISDQVLRVLNRTEKKRAVDQKKTAKEEEKEKKEDALMKSGFHWTTNN
jgi:hypothetical protein